MNALSVPLGILIIDVADDEDDHKRQLQKIIDEDYITVNQAHQSPGHQILPHFGPPKQSLALRSTNIKWCKRLSATGHVVISPSA